MNKKNKGKNTMNKSFAFVLITVFFVFNQVCANDLLKKEVSIIEFFSTYSLPEEHRGAVDYLKQRSVYSQPANHDVIKQKLASLESKSTKSEERHGAVGVVLYAIGYAKDDQIKLQALDLLVSTFLNDRETTDADRRISLELQKIVGMGQSESVYSKILFALAKTGDPRAVRIITEAVQAHQSKPIFMIFEALNEYFVRIGVNPRISISIQDFMQLHFALKDVFNGDQFAQKAKELALREVGMQRLRTGKPPVPHVASEEAPKEPSVHENLSK